MLFRSGESYFLTPDEMNQLNEHNEDFTAMDPIAEKISTKLAWDEPVSLWTWRNVTSILESIGLDKPSRGDATAAGIHLRRINGGKSKRSNGVGYVLAPSNR